MAVVLHGASILAACSGRPLTVGEIMSDAGPPRACPAQVTVLATNFRVATGIALDGQYIYVGTARGPFRIPVRGGSPEKVSAGSPQTSVVAVDSTYVYWNDWTGPNQGNGFSRRTKTLTDPEERIVATGAISCILPEPSALSWCDFSNAGTGRIVTADRDGRAPRELASGQDGPDNLVSVGDSLYWGLLAAEGRMGRVAKGGSPTSIIRLGAQGPNGLAADTRTIYASANGLMMTGFAPTPVEGILAYDVATGQFRTLAVTPQYPRYVATDDTFVYWSEQYNELGRIMRAPKNGGTPAPVASDDKTPDHLVVDAETVYWISDRTSVKAACK
jgi:hypothetical protein